MKPFVSILIFFLPLPFISLFYFENYIGFFVNLNSLLCSLIYWSNPFEEKKDVFKFYKINRLFFDRLSAVISTSYYSQGIDYQYILLFLLIAFGIYFSSMFCKIEIHWLIHVTVFVTVLICENEKKLYS